MFQLSARDEIAGGDQRLNHRFVGVAFVAFLGDDALALKARRILCVKAVFIDGVGNARVDAALCELAAIRHPNVEVLAAMTRRRMHEARSRIVGDMLAIEERNFEAVAIIHFRKWMIAFAQSQSFGVNALHPFESLYFCGFEYFRSEFVSKNVSPRPPSPNCSQELELRDKGHNRSCSKRRSRGYREASMAWSSR